jgi:glucokinase
VRVLAGDIGGTHTRLALVEIGRAAARVLMDRTVPSHSAPSLAPLIVDFLRVLPDRAERACFGIAGPVVGGMVRATNLPWTIEARTLGAAIGIPDTSLINDFEAVGYGIPLLAPQELVTLQAGEPVERGPIAVLGAGTGLGAGFLLWEAGGYRVHPSEGGHASFAAQTPRELALLAFLAKRYEHVSCERVLSGPGLVAIFESLAGRVDESAAISERALAGTDPAAVEALDLFAAAFGAAAGNLALTVLATGGVYLAGGIAPQIVAKLRDGTFMAAFRRKGRLAPVLERVPVRIVMSPDVGVLGAAAAAERRPG